MQKLILFVCFAVLLNLTTVQAQDLVITNARIIVGNGQVIEQGSLVVRNGRIVSAAAGAPANAAGTRIDARGMSIMPGYSTAIAISSRATPISS